MPATYSIDLEQQVVYTVFSGEVVEAEVRTMALRLGKDPNFQPDFSELLDLSAVTDFRISTEDLQGLSAVDPFSGRARRAFVSPGDLLFGISRMYEGIRGSNAHIATFRTMGDARQWLDLDQRSA
ncbi:MAG TPA: hypothetical protein VMZ25_01150 [Terriglobales bacterium]|nr:hypothetical protein [Terriglobales bacterium]